MLRVKEGFAGKVQMQSGERTVRLDENTTQEDLAKYGGCFVEEVVSPKKVESKAIESKVESTKEPKNEK